MFIYSIFGGVFIFLSHILFKNHRNDKILLLLMYFLLVFLEGFRNYSVGTDTKGYVKDYVFGNFKDYEILIREILKVLRLISTNPTFMLIIMALLINGLILLAIYRDSCNLRQSLYIFIFMLFYFISFNAMRQSLAYALVLNSFVSIKNKKILSFLFFLIPAVFIHTSSFIGIIYIIIFFIKDLDKSRDNSSVKINNKKNILMIMCIFIVTTIILKKLDSIIVNIVHFIPRYETYIKGDYSFFLLIKGGISKPVIYTIIFLCFIFLVREDYEKKVYIVPLFICVVLSFISYRIAYIERFIYYFDIVYVLSIPYMFKQNRFTSNSKIFFSLLVQLSILAYGIYMLSYGFMRVKEYNFIWNM